MTEAAPPSSGPSATPTSGPSSRETPSSGASAVSAVSAARAPISARDPSFPRIDKFELIEEIGHGGMATVYRARDPRLGREVAVKVIHKHLRENLEVGTRFVAEARAAAKLRHPGIVDVFDVSPEDDVERYLVVELLRGTTLRKVLQEHRDMPAEIGAAIVLQISEALEHAHASAIVHRDVKPENVLVELPADRAAVSGAQGKAVPPADPQNETPAPSLGSPASPVSAPADSGPKKHARHDPGVVIKITDFGIAKILDAQSMTSTGQVLGSPAHMAPEQIEGGDVDARTDVFALGVLMYECLVGHLPFEGKNPAQVLRRVLAGTYAAPDAERATVGGRWSRLVARALARDPQERTASAAQLAEQIRQELVALGIEDGHAEINAYFEDPRGYTESQAARLVPRLVARGEASRKSGDIPGAAADFNRALALSPADLAILRRIGQLTSSAGRRQMLRRAGAIVAGSVVLGLGAFQVARAVKASSAAHAAAHGETDAAAFDEDAPLGPEGPDGPPGVDGVPPGPASSGRSATEPVGKRLHVPATPGFTLAPVVLPSATAAPSGTRMVQFVLNPKGAKLTVDGSPRSSFFPLSLPVGPHAVEVIPNVDRCCKKLAVTVTVEPPPPSAPASVQQFSLAMEIRPATVTLSGAPQNGQLSCPELSMTCFAGSSKQVKLPEASWTGTCRLAVPDKPPRSVRVTLNAGDTNAIPWPVD